MNDYTGLAKTIKKELTAKFPGVKFGVSQASSHGCIDIMWEDGPSHDDMYKITNKYTAGRFDGMTDSYDHKEDRDPSRTYATHILFHRNRSDKVQKEAFAYATSRARWKDGDVSECDFMNMPHLYDLTYGFFRDYLREI